ncbi:MAG: GNAT family N-acetyltransferase [Lachnospirales bacterium]
MNKNIIKAKEILNRNINQNKYSILRLNQNAIGKIYIKDNCVCLWDKEYNKYLYTTYNAQNFLDLFSEVQSENGMELSLVNNGCDVRKSLLRLNSKIDFVSCYQMIPQNITKKIKYTSDIAFMEITKDFAKWMVSVYKHPELTIDFILRRTRKNPYVIACNNNKEPIGFFLTHSDAELGPVYVSPEYRSSGLADIMYEKMIKSFSHNNLPILFVMENNNASYKWLTKLGCYLCEEKMLWFYIN